MANLTITNTFVTGTQALAAQVNQNFTDVSSYVNARNAGTTAWDAGSFAGAVAFADGTVTAPSISIGAGVTNKGFYSSGVDSFGWVTAGTLRADLTTTELRSRVNVVAAGGTNNLGSAADSWARAYFGDGTVALPSHTFGSDTDCGMYRIGANNIAFATAGTKALEIDASQNVNIPNTKLQVTGNQVLPLLQIVQATTTTGVSTSSSSFTDSNLSVTITPKFSTSKILITASGVLRNDAAGGLGVATLARGSTNLMDAGSGGAIAAGSSGSLYYTTTLQYYDSPATTSATTYKVRIRAANLGATTFGVGETQVITVTEIAQ